MGAMQLVAFNYFKTLLLVILVVCLGRRIDFGVSQKLFWNTIQVRSWLYVHKISRSDQTNYCKL